jgi:alginate O-acetyltransferase complex protein AlgI
MTIQEILILSAASLILGLAFRSSRQVNLLMVASIVFIYWLQPDTGLRNLGYWLPSISLVIMVAAWAATASPETRNQPEHLKSLAVLFAVPLVLSSLRFIDPKGVLAFVDIPRIINILPYLLIAFSLLALFTRYKKSLPGEGYWVLFGVILFIFLILKTPYLTQYAAKIWRGLAGQSTALAATAELSWLGFSYLAFRILHTLRDKQTGRLPDIALNEYITYLVFFPAFVAGPIARADQFTASLREVSDTFPEDLIAGSRRIIMGLFKKYVLADTLSLIALNSQNALHPTSSLGGWVLLYAFSLQIYLDFSGYTDIAIGLARLMNIQLPENFNQPYLKPNLTQFWSNWHMTLTNWFRAYFFNPISRQLRKNKMSALGILFITQLSTMVLVGMWHGISFNFVVWGLWHGLGLLIQNRWSGWISKKFPPTDKKWVQDLRRGTGVVLTFHYVTLGWIWFILPTPGLARDFFFTLFGAGL